MMRLTQITMIFQFPRHFFMKNSFHLCPKISHFSKAKIIHILKTVHLIHSIFFPGIISSTQLSIYNEKPAKMLKNTLNYTCHKNQYIIYVRNAKKAHNSNTVQHFHPIFFPGVISPSKLSITIAKPPKKLKKVPL